MIHEHKINLPYDSNKMALWQILVPTMRNDGRPIKTRFHRVWDSKVREITGGLTVCTPVKGQWVNEEEDGKLYHERMIPVQIACSANDIETIAKMTKKYYEQEKIFFYLLSESVFII